MATTRSLIDGELVDAVDVYENVDPSTGRALGDVARCGAAEVDRAVQSAQRANRSWRRTTPEQRAELLSRLSERISANAESLARAESEDTGKPLSQARTDAQVCARYFNFYAHAIDSYYGSTIPLRPELLVYTRHEPFGVAGHIVAWNYPMQLLARGVAPAIATGNCSVLKPADETPRTAVMVAELALEAGLPPGVFNVVTGLGPEAGAALADHPGVGHLGFVGSTRVGSLVAQAAAQRVSAVVLELGGKSAHLVYADADIEAAVPVIAKAILQNAGQTCSAGSRVVVDKAVHDQLVAGLVERFEAVTVGPGLDDPDLGPLISRKQQDRVRGFVSSNTTGDVLTGGTVVEPRGITAGAYFAPTLIDGVDPQSPIAQEEIFGPVLTVTPFSSEEEAISIANGTSYALLGAIWTGNLSRAHRVAAEIEAGQVYVNSYGAGGGVELPFGGFRNSGYGREKGYQALDSYTQTKTVVVQL
jgi:aldehyde dehydrogenase (NAD+)